MELNDFLDNEVETTSTELVKVEEGQLIISKNIQEQLINFDLIKKMIDKKEKEMKSKLYEIMKENGITKYESNDKRIMITLGEDGITETIDKERLWLEKPDIYREYLKQTIRKGSLRITTREEKEI